MSGCERAKTAKLKTKPLVRAPAGRLPVAFPAGGAGVSNGRGWPGQLRSPVLAVSGNRGQEPPEGA